MTSKSQKSILVVEDDYATLTLLLTLFESRGFQVFSAKDGLEAIEILKNHKIDLMTLDIALPHMDGIELLPKIRDINPVLPIIILSVWGEYPEEQARAEPYNISAFFSKPFDINEIDKTIQKALFIKMDSREPESSIDRNLPQRIARYKIPLNMRWISVFIFILTGVIVFSLSRVNRKYNLKQDHLPLSFNLPYSNPTGITWDKKNLWISDWVTRRIYKHRIDRNLTLEKYILFSDVVLINIAEGGSVLWSIGQDKNIRKHLMDDQLTVSSVFRMPDKNLSTLAWDGKRLWSYDSESLKLFKHVNDENLTVERAYHLPGLKIVGMVWIDENLWIADEGSGTIYCLDYDEDIFTVKEKMKLESHLPGRNRLSGLCFDGKNFWTISDGSGLVFRHPIENAVNN